MIQEDNISIRPLSPALRKKAEEELKETPENIVSHLKILQEWIKTQPNLKKMENNNHWLIAFLRGCKHDVEKAKGKLQMYAKLKATVPELYENRDPFDPVIQELLKFGILLPLRKTMSEDGPRISLTRLGPYSLTHRSLLDFLKVFVMIMEIMLIEDDHFAVAGGAILSDVKGMGLGLILQWTPSLAKKMMTCLAKAMSVRINSAHFLDPPYGLSIGIAILKMFLTVKIKNRIQLYNKDSLYKNIDKSVLPEEYGGTDGTLQELIDYWKQKVESYRDWFLDSN